MNRSDYDQDSVQGSESSQHELTEEEQAQHDAEIATKMSNYIDPALDRIKPLLKLINEVCILTVFLSYGRRILQYKIFIMRLSDYSVWRRSH